MTGPGAPEPGWARRRRRPYLVTALALLGSAGLVFGAWLIDRGRAAPHAPPRVRERPVAELVTPGPLSEQERQGTGPRFGAQEAVRLQAGAWVQVADAQGNVKQQYTASRIDPRAVLYGEGGRVVTMRSDSMTARVPRRELESGRLEGNVVIRVYRPQDGRAVDLKSDRPSMVVESPEATFDSESGEIRCDRAVRITGDAISFDGEGLSLALSPDGRNLERLVIDRATAPVRIVRSAIEQEAGRPVPAETQAEAQAPAKAAPKPGAAAPGKAAPAGARPGAAARAGAAAGPAAPAPEARRLFRLTLHDDVSVVSVEKGRRTEVRGDRLDAVFLLRGGTGVGLSLGGPFDAGGFRHPAADGAPHAPSAVAVLPGSPAGQIAALAVASLPAAAVEEDEVTVNFRGRLVLAPAPDGTAPLAQPDGVRVTVAGSPATITDSRSEATITASRATFESKVDRVLLEGADRAPASVRTPSFALTAPRFELDRAGGSGRADGAGRVVLGGGDRKPLEVAWQDAMRIALAPGTGDAEGSFRGAEFTGGVVASSPDFRLSSDTLAVEAAPVGRKDVIRRIQASGQVRAERLGASRGRFEADRVEIALTPDAQAQAQPRTLVATGEVMAGDDGQTLWCSMLRVTFLEQASKPAAEPPTGDMRSDIGEVVGEGPVELRLSDGSRLFATRLEADGAGRSARLVGPDVLVVRGNLVLDQLSELRAQEGPTRVNAVGPGRASAFRDPVIAVTEGRAGRPRIAGLPQMQVTWRDSLAFEDGAIPARGGEPAKGLLLLQGSAKVRASREPREAEALDADELQVELVPDGSAPATGAAPGGGARQVVGAMRANGNVRLEARQWRDASRAGDPRLFRMNAPNVSYDGRDGSALVDGAGTLLLHDPPAAPAADAPAGGGSPFSPQGTTRFSWKRSLTLQRAPNGDSRVMLEQDAVMDHLGASAATTGSVTADRMMATVRAAPGAKAAAAPADVGMALGGPAELMGVSAGGRVVVRTEDLDIEANEFELDVPSQVGAARAEPGRLVTVLRRGQSAPLRGHAFRWDLAKGTLAVEGARGSIGR